MNEVAVKDKPILNLTLHRKWFDMIVTGEKTEEYREDKPYWQKRLDGRKYDEVWFKNGYRKDSPMMRVVCLGIFKRNRYTIKLGAILEVRNYHGTNTISLNGTSLAGKV